MKAREGAAAQNCPAWLPPLFRACLSCSATRRCFGDPPGGIATQAHRRWYSRRAFPLSLHLTRGVGLFPSRFSMRGAAQTKGRGPRAMAHGAPCASRHASPAGLSHVFGPRPSKLGRERTRSGPLRDPSHSCTACCAQILHIVATKVMHGSSLLPVTQEHTREESGRACHVSISCYQEGREQVVGEAKYC